MRHLAKPYGRFRRGSRRDPTVLGLRNHCFRVGTAFLLSLFFLPRGLPPSHFLTRFCFSPCRACGVDVSDSVAWSSATRRPNPNRQPDTKLVRSLTLSLLLLVRWEGPSSTTRGDLDPGDVLFIEENPYANFSSSAFESASPGDYPDGLFSWLDETIMSSVDQCYFLEALYERCSYLVSSTRAPATAAARGSARATHRWRREARVRAYGAWTRSVLRASD